MNKNMSMPKYAVAQNAIIDMIARKQMQSGDRLPNEFELSKYCGCSTITTRRALQELVRLGVIKRQQGRGTFVNRIPVNGRRIGTVLFIVAGAESGLYERMLGSAERALQERGFGIRHIATSQPDDVTTSETAAATGVLISGNVTREWIRFLKVMAKPFVVLGNCEADAPSSPKAADKLPAAWQVNYNWDRALELLTRELLRRGCREIGLLNAARRYPPAAVAHAACSRVLSEAGIGLPDERVIWIKRGEYTQRVGEFMSRNHASLDGLVIEQAAFTHVLAWFYEHGRTETRPVLGIFSDEPMLQSAYEHIIEAGFRDSLAKRGVEQLFGIIGGSNKSTRAVLLEPYLSAKSGMDRFEKISRARTPSDCSRAGEASLPAALFI